MKKIICFALASTLGLSTTCFAADPSVQVGFSPEGSAHTLVLSAIESAHTSIRMLSYSFTARDIVQALIAAKKRGVDVKIVVDEKGNRGRYSVAAMNLIVNNQIPIRTDSEFPIQHDKTMIIDDQSVETGSFNFTDSAEKRNSENALVIWNMPKLAQSYTAHWQDRWDRGEDYHSAY